MPELEKSIKKPWGHEEIVYESDELIVLRMFLQKGEETSLHQHLQRDEHFVIWGGRGRLLREGQEVPINPGDTFTIKRGQKHRWMADRDVEIVEVTTPPLDDLVRIEDKYKR